MWHGVNLLKAMESFVSEVSWYVWMFGAAAGAFIAFKFLFPASRKKRANLPPSPGVMPIVGSFPFMGAKPHEPPYKMFSRLAEKCGPITYLQLGHNPTIIVSNGDIAKQILRDQDHIFHSRPYLSVGKYIGINYHLMSFAPSGPYFKRLRKLYKDLLAPKRISGTQAVREKVVFATLGAVKHLVVKEREEVINLSSVLRDLSLHTLMAMLFGWKEGNEMVKSFGTVELSDMKDLIRDVIEVSGEFNAGDFITIARWLDLQGVMGRMKKINKRMIAIAAVLLEEYECDGKKSPDSRDATIVDMLLSLEGDDKLDSESITGVLYDLLIGGSDTTGQASDWTVAEVLKQPELVRRLQDELDTVIGKDRFVTEADIPNLPFLQAIVKESLRLHPPGALGIPHCNTEDCKIEGYDIPAGTTAMLNIVEINRDPKYWLEPRRFFPDRFFMQDKENDLSPFGSAYHYLPFGSGRRICPGMQLASPMLHLIVANFMHAFEYQAAGGLANEEIDVITEAPGAMKARANDLCVTAAPRLYAEVYEKF